MMTVSDRGEDAPSSTDSPLERGHGDVKEIFRLQQELVVAKKIQITFVSVLRTLESARDDVSDVGRRIDRCGEASEECRRRMVALCADISAAGEGPSGNVV